jgi:hypothetical protein
VAGYFHVSPRSNRESILEQGLIGHLERRMWTARCQQRGQPRGNYVFDHLEAANEYAGHLCDSMRGFAEEFAIGACEQFDVWRVNLEGLKVEPDPENVHKFGRLSLDEAERQARRLPRIVPCWVVRSLVTAGRLSVETTHDWGVNPRLRFRARHTMSQSFTQVPGYVWQG